MNRFYYNISAPECQRIAPDRKQHPNTPYRQKTASPENLSFSEDAAAFLFFCKYCAFQLLLCRIEVHLQNRLAADVCPLIGAVCRDALLCHIIGRKL